MPPAPDVGVSSSARRASRFGRFLPASSAGGFALSIVAVIGISVFSFRALEERGQAADRTNRSMAVLESLEQLRSTVKDAETGQRGFLLTKEERYLEPYLAAKDSLPVDVGELRALLSDSPAEQAILDRIHRMINAKLIELEETIQLERDGKLGEARAVVKTDRGKVLMDDIRQATAELKEARIRALDQHNKQWAEAATLTTLVTVAGSATLLFLIVSAAFVTSRDFRAQQVHAWVRTGLAHVSAKVAGEQAIEQLGEQALRALADHLDAQVGALYVKQLDGRFRRVAGYALPAQEDAFRAGDGLIGQATKESRVIEVTSVPPGYLSVTSGLGKGDPRALIIAPISADGVVNGVVELGFLHAVHPSDRELLELAGKTIGIGVRASLDHRRLQDLLEETQRQSEELQTQQEELRVQNEELEQQSRALQESQTRLENQQAELEQINSQLEEQTQALERQRDDLSVARRDLQRTNDYKSEFLANMSHELRTPLNSSLILAKLLADNRDGNLTAEQIKFAQTIYAAGNDLLTLINDILDLSRIEAGKLDVRPENLTVARAVDDLVNTFGPIARERRLNLDMSVAEGVPETIFTDSTRLQQILKNLLANALKFTEQGGVTLHVRPAGEGRLAFEVRDTGIGIAPDQHQVIFEAFRQADGTTNRKYGGTGLGLSISRDLARLLGGELSVDSAPGRGSTFTLTLPVQIPQREAGAVRVRKAPESPRDAAPRAEPVRRAPPPPAQVLASGAIPGDDRAALAQGGRVLLVIEDDLAFAQVLQDLAHELGFQVLVAHTAEDGLALAERYQPSAIALDVGLPDRSGLSVLDTLKHHRATRHIPVHMMSVLDHTHSALEMGAAGYAIKPVAREQLVAALERLEAKFTQKLRRVLVVEDDATLREATCQLIAGADVEAVAVGTVAEALAQLASTTFDCMVMDLSLPDRSGFELLEEMSGQEQRSFPPVIVYTGRNLSREEEQKLRRFSRSIIIKGARSPERLLDEVTLFLHQVESDLPPERQRMLRDARHRESVFEGRRVLVVEDDVRNIFALSSVLEPKGAKVEIARNGKEALAHLAAKPGVDLVLMDVMMPEMDGLEATREIRKQPALAKLPIIALTAKAMADDRDKCLSAGANDYIAKPLDVDKLLSLARVWMPK